MSKARADTDNRNKVTNLIIRIKQIVRNCDQRLSEKLVCKFGLYHIHIFRGKTHSKINFKIGFLKVCYLRLLNQWYNFK
jgi:hypothetical protein